MAAPPRLPRFYAPPDASLSAVDFPDLVAALQRDLLKSVSVSAGAGAGAAVTKSDAEAAAAGFGAVASRVEALLAIELVSSTRRLRRRLAPFDPRAGAVSNAALQPVVGSASSSAPASSSSSSSSSSTTAPSDGSSGSSVSNAAAAPPAASSLEAQEAALFDSLVALLLSARYAPLTAAQWQSARGSTFTFDIPVRIDWAALDPKPLGRYFGLLDGSSGSTLDGSSSSSSGGVTYTVEGAAAASASPPDAAAASDPRWGALPPFSDHVLVFVRGVGAASATGQYYSEKLDLLVSYALLEPLASAASAVWSAAFAPLVRPLLERSEAARKAAAWLAGSGPYSNYDLIEESVLAAASATDDLPGDDEEGGGVGGRRSRLGRLGSFKIGGGAASGGEGEEEKSAAGEGTSDHSAVSGGGGGSSGGSVAVATDPSPALARLEAAAAAAAAATAGAGKKRRRAARFVARRTLRTLLPTIPEVALALPREELLTEPTCE
jgi:hypothetical protein